MKLKEIIQEDIADQIDPYQALKTDDQEECGVDVRHKGKAPVVKQALPDSNIEKAKRIRSLAKMKAKEASSTENEDTHHTSHMGGHGSAFLHR